MKIRKIVILVAALLIVLLLGGCGRIKRISGRKEMAAMEEYLQAKYGTEDFDIRSPEGDEGCYKVTSQAFPEITFQIRKNTNPKILADFTDDYDKQVFGFYAEQYEIPWTINETGDKAFVTYSDYEDIDDFSVKLKGLVTDYKAAGLYQWFYTIKTISIFAKEKWPEYVSGANIELSPVKGAFPEIDFDSGPASQWEQAQELYDNIGTISAENLEQDSLAIQLKLHYIYNMYNYTFPLEEPEIPKEDMALYLSLCGGVTGTDKEGNVTEYKNVHMFNGLSIGGVYQILKAEGLITGVSGNGFTASGRDGMIFQAVVSEDDGNVHMTWTDDQGEIKDELEDNLIYPDILYDLTFKNVDVKHSP